MRKELIVQSSIPEFEHDGDKNDWLDFAIRSLTLALDKPGRSIVVLPETGEVVTYLEQFREIIHQLGLRDVDTLMLPYTNYFLDLVVAEHMQILKPHLSKNDHHAVRPYAHTENLDLWMSEMERDGYNVSTHFAQRVYFENLNHPQHRGPWAGRLTDEPSDGKGGNGYFPNKYNIPYPTSYMGIGLDEIKEARRRVISESGVETVYAKLLFGAGGFGISRITSDEELSEYYRLVQQSGALMLFGKEQPFEIQAEIKNVVAFASMQFVGDRITTPGILSIQHIEGNNWRGNRFNTQIVNKCVPQAISIFKNIHQGLMLETGASGGGGIDLAIVQSDEDMKLVMVEPNFDREVGANSAIDIAKALNVSNKPFLIRKFPKPSCDLATFWETMRAEGLSFDTTTKQGLFPIIWAGDSGYVFAGADSEQELESLVNNAINVLVLNNYIS